MLTEKDGAHYKYVCPECGGDGIGESGLGGGMVHCFGHCMADFPKTECKTVLVTDEAELAVLKQPAY